MLKNADLPLQIPTYDGSGQCVHPDVISGLHSAFRSTYAMVMEPYPYSDSALENPSIVISDDGIVWAVPSGLRNPVTSFKTAGSWHSDAIIFPQTDGRCSLYYRHNSGAGETTLLERSSVDGLAWSSELTLMTVEVSGRFASPSIFRHGETMKMVYVDTLAESVYVLTSADGLKWHSKQRLLAFPKAWHVCARLLNEQLYLLLNDRVQLYLLRLNTGRWEIRDRNNWRTVSEEPASNPPILQPSSNGWDSKLIYHGSFLRAGDTIRVWYSAASKEGAWNIGHTYGELW